MNDLTSELKGHIKQELKLPDEFDAVEPGMPLFDNPHVKIDSIDAVVIIVMLQKNYGIKIQDMPQGRKILYSIQTIADYVKENRK